MSDEQPQTLSPEPGSGEPQTGPENEQPGIGVLPDEGTPTEPEPAPPDAVNRADTEQAAIDAAHTKGVDYETIGEGVPSGEYPAEGTFGYVSGDGEQGVADDENTEG